MGTENHVAEIANTNTLRMWAEPETGGEAYIPLASAKRPRSTAILRQVAERFGYGLEPRQTLAFAQGGITQAAPMGGGSTSIVVHGSSVTVQGTADRDLLNDVRNLMDDRDRRLQRALRARSGR